MKRVAVALGTAWLYASAVSAAPLGLTQQFPDIQTSDLNISYDAGTGSLSANQPTFAMFTYSDGITSTQYYDWTYSLTASLDSGTGTLTSGSLEIQDGSSVTQLSGSLTAFGYTDAGSKDVFEFLFDVTGGALAGDFGALGGIIIVTDTSDFTGDFGIDFTAASTSNDTFAAVVPVPAAVWLFGSGLLGLAAAARRRH
ncbi:hypothetical protein TspCOW1_30110 [Thiohalobacter sp. COW1]|uniref:Zn-dependent protease n=1 Tax=Thiohalobacter thiocyanaticus TaxID=585455 RepID=A0A1Z4VVF4_9GAMM|nr:MULTISPECIES: VPLPA-CTERM sorting domain-containing protein [Thiohalobacter]BAZ95164.1 Zn-dependent protease [Thiohalobacter thiocyanaticus]BCO32908.1 hypothetical protein TspCOW1_30110 [Thiohalobacter sp. COW1]